MLHAASNDADDSWCNDNTREMYTGAEFDGVSEEEDDSRRDSSVEGNYQTQLQRNCPPDGCINAKYI